MAVALAFTVLFCFLVLPSLYRNPDILAAFAAGFVNPYAAGYSADGIACWLILAIWVVFEAKTRSIRRGWICLMIGIIPGVAVGFASYLLLRLAQINRQLKPKNPSPTVDNQIVGR